MNIFVSGEYRGLPRRRARLVSSAKADGRAVDRRPHADRQRSPAGERSEPEVSTNAREKKAMNAESADGQT